MDFQKPRYTPMSRRRRIYEGKAKILYEGPEPGTLIQHFKDDATAFNAKKHEVIEGKGVLNNRISEYVFQHLNDIGVPTHFIRRLNMREQLIREVEIIPLEVVVRNVAAGSLATRLGIDEGTQLPRSIIEFYYKNDALNDPMVSEEHITAFGWASPQEIDDIMALAIRVNDFLSGLFLGVGIRLVDFKMEAGRLWENDVMRIVVADEISPDSCRLWDIKTNDKLDKDRFRRDLGGLLEAYTEVAKRLGIMNEGEPPRGAGPGAGERLGNRPISVFLAVNYPKPGLVPGFGVSSLGVDGREQARARPANSCDKPSAMKARVTVTLKSGILDPQGKAIEGALRSLGVAGVASVRQGKVFDIEIEGADRAKAEALLKQAADKLSPIP